jgi:pyridoxal biosynthesis lyase PdxS
MKKELELLPPDVKPETLQEDLNRIKQGIAELKAKSESKQTEVDAEVSKVAAVQRAVDNLARKKEDRQKAFERNSMSFSVVAVNSDWGFVVVNAGEPEGISESTKLIVTRGTQTIGKISILSVSGGRTIANILTDTLTPGYSIEPGDKVILENLYQ